MGTQSQAQAQLGMFGAMSRAGGVGGANASLLQKAGNTQNPMLLKVSVHCLYSQSICE